MKGDTYSLAGHTVRRVGFGAMQLPGSGVFGPPRDHGRALAVLRRAVEAGVNHIDTAQFYGPKVANELIHEALFPYPGDLVLVTKVGAARDERGGWAPAQRPGELRTGVEANLRSLELDQIPVVNLRRLPTADVEFGDQVNAMVEMRNEGVIGGIGLSNVTLDEYQAARARTEIACVQNAFSVADRSGQGLFDACTQDNPVLGAAAVRDVGARIGATPAQVALAWLLHLADNVLLIPGTSSLQHLEENLSVGSLELDGDAMAALDRVGLS